TSTPSPTPAPTESPTEAPTATPVPTAHTHSGGKNRVYKKTVYEPLAQNDAEYMLKHRQIDLYDGECVVCGEIYEIKAPQGRKDHFLSKKGNGLCVCGVKMPENSLVAEVPGQMDVYITLDQSQPVVFGPVSISAGASGGSGSYDYAWTIDGAPAGTGDTLQYSHTFGSGDSQPVEIVVTVLDTKTGLTASTPARKLIPHYHSGSRLVSSSASPSPDDPEKTVVRSTYLCDLCGGTFFTEMTVDAAGGVCPDGTPHQYDAHFEETHPHQLYLICLKCGAREDRQICLPYYYDCCTCAGHNWGDMYSPETYVYEHRCTRCGAVESVRADKGTFLADFYHEMTLAYRGAKLEQLSEDARELLTSTWFVAVSEAVNATKDAGETIISAAEELVSGNTYDQELEAQYEYCITRMLTDCFTEEDDSFTETFGLLDEVVNHAGEISTVLGIADMTDTNQTGYLETVIKAAAEAANRDLSAVDPKTAELIQKLAQKGKYAEKALNALETLDIGANVLSVGVKTTEAANRQKVYAMLAADYAASAEKLDHLAEAAEIAGNPHLKAAVKSVRDRIGSETDAVLSMIGSGVYAGGREISHVLLNKFLEGSSAPLAAMQAVGTLADMVLDYSDLYSVSYELMINSTVISALRSDVGKVYKENVDAAYYLTELYSAGRIVGCEYAKDFIYDYEDALGYSVDDLGFSTVEAVQTSLDGHMTSVKKVQLSWREIYESDWE
ncbi:MAG: hypothetical protein Q4G19_09080, partial [Clostridia bacterium]|nr:hypothetical protein [Clostridia bacterium]